MKKAILTTLLAISFMLTMTATAISHRVITVWLCDSDNYVYELGVEMPSPGATLPHFDLAGYRFIGTPTVNAEPYPVDGAALLDYWNFLQIGLECQCLWLLNNEQFIFTVYNVRAVLSYDYEDNQWKGTLHWRNPDKNRQGIATKAWLQFTPPPPPGPPLTPRE
ncbi:MAG: hypothetical protein AB1422_08760 [bacterium]